MRSTAALIVGVTILTTISIVGRQSRSADDQAVRDVVRRYVAAREARDPAAVAALFAADADQLVSSGEWRLGREKVVEGSLASTERTGGKREIAVERVRFV
jgi:uncharacterized protein (TIGR02246 family)